jgi:predicted AlkP superfamily phosphohydrolase/phosphomutase
MARIGIGTHLTLSLALIATAHACGIDPGASHPRGRVLLVGIDGASLRVMEPLFEKGALPHLAKLRSEGVSGPLRSIMPLQSPRIWNSIATGKEPEKHGITAFARLVGPRQLRLYLGSDRKAHALWNIVSDARMTVAVVNWWNTFPPERINGVMISDHLQPGEIEGREEIAHASETPSGALIFPESWTRRLTPLLDIEESPVAFDDPFKGNDRLPHIGLSGERLSRSFRDDGTILRLAREVEEAEVPDVMLVFFPGIDRVSHFLWGMVEPGDKYAENLRPTAEGRAAGLRAFERYYEYTDALLGVLFDRYGPEDLVMVVSDHGFEAGNDLGILTGVHRSESALDGVIFARGPGIASGEPAGATSVLDITPTILAWLGLPVGDDMDGEVAPFVELEQVARVASHDVSPVDWLETAPSGSDERILEDLRALGYLEDE